MTTKKKHLNVMKFLQRIESFDEMMSLCQDEMENNGKK